MSANIYWRPTSSNGKCLDVGAPSSFMESLSRAFHYDLPMTLNTESEAVKLEGMAAASQGEFAKAYQQLADAIRYEGSIEVHARW